MQLLEAKLLDAGDGVEDLCKEIRCLAPMLPFAARGQGGGASENNFHHKEPKLPGDILSFLPQCSPYLGTIQGDVNAYFPKTWRFQSSSCRGVLQVALFLPPSVPPSPLPSRVWAFWHWRAAGSGNKLTDLQSDSQRATKLDRVQPLGV